MWRAVVACGCLSACVASEEPTDPTDPLTDEDDDDTDEPPTTGCVEVTQGPWSMNGSCFMHEMFATITTTGDGCAFEFSDWSMAMSVPEGGIVSGEDVALTGPYWDYCYGTTDGDSIDGGCTTGCTFGMDYDG